MISFDGVGVRYADEGGASGPEGAAVFSGATFRVPEGELVLVVGPTGSGKAVKAFKQQFQASGEENLPLGHEPDAGELETEIEQEKIVKQKR